VKTQAISVYHKLGVSSRSRAAQRLQEIGLLARQGGPGRPPFILSG
jgi:ATP/maltotriose-dependent transcriptional regulator MalT